MLILMAELSRSVLQSIMLRQIFATEILKYIKWQEKQVRYSWIANQMIVCGVGKDGTDGAWVWQDAAAVAA